MVLSKESHWNPRLVYDLDGNIIFVQKIYECIAPHGSSWPKHSFLSASKTIMDMIPVRISEHIPIILHYINVLLPFHFTTIFGLSMN